MCEIFCFPDSEKLGGKTVFFHIGSLKSAEDLSQDWMDFSGSEKAARF